MLSGIVRALCRDFDRELLFWLLQPLGDLRALLVKEHGDAAPDVRRGI